MAGTSRGSTAGALTLLSAVLLAALISASPASAKRQLWQCQDGTPCARASADGKTVVFSTSDRLLPEDEKSGMDVYELTDGRALRLLTPDLPGETGQSATSHVKGISRDGSRVLIETAHAYSPEDVETDFYPRDVYVLHNGTWSLVTKGPDNVFERAIGLTGDGRHVYFETEAAIAPNDTDQDLDIYEWHDGAISMVSTGPTERTEPMPPHLTTSLGFGGATDDGSRVFFLYGDELTAGSDAGQSPLWLRLDGATTEWVPLPGTLPGSISPYSFASDLSPDGTRLYVSTNLRIDPSDTDTRSDVYVRSADGVFTLISRDSSGAPGGGGYLGASRSGDRVFFSSGDRLVPEDTDTSNDIYERSGSTTTLLTPGTEDQPKPMSYVRAPQFEAASDDGTQVAFTTWSRLLPADTDSRPDVYVRAGGRYYLISTGPPSRQAKHDPAFGDFVGDGDSVIFWTAQPLVDADNDSEVDVYERIDFVAKPGAGKRVAAAAAGKRKGKKKGKAKVPGRTKLVSAERIPPRIGIAGSGRVRRGRAQVRITCPKREESGSCAGIAKAAGAGKGGFKLKRGRSGWVTVGSAQAVGGSASVTVKAKDGLGNRAKARKRVRF